MRITPPSPSASRQIDRALSTVLLGFRTPGVRNDENDLPALDVLLYLLGSGSLKSGRGLLHDALVEKGWAHDVKAEYVPGRHAGLILLSATTLPRHAAAFDERITD